MARGATRRYVVGSVKKRLPPASLHSACPASEYPNERCEKLRIKFDPRIGQTIMRSGWLVMSQKFCLESVDTQTVVKLLSRDSEPRRQSDIGIKSRQRGIVQSLRRWMKAMQTVRPASNDNDLIKPRRERFDQTRKRREVRIGIHARPIWNK